MSILEIILIGLGLSMDCFAVSVSFGTSRMLYGKFILRTAVFFGLFQGFMLIAGWLIGDSVKVFLSSVDHWIALAILAFIGVKMIAESFEEVKKEGAVDIRKTKYLVSLSVATSIDALITGISFGFIQVNILVAAGFVAGVTFLNSILGALVGRRTTFLPARWAERAGGAVLILIGLKIVLEHIGLI